MLVFERHELVLDRPEAGRRMVYYHWGDRAARALLCVHGLTRTGRDFDHLASRLCDRYQLICPDIIGRGQSDWLANGKAYGYPAYIANVQQLIAGLRLDEVDCLGTSMGGLIGMMIAAAPGTPIRRLIMNDVGPCLPAAALQRIANYLGDDPRFGSLDELEAYLREVHAPFGPLDDAQWRHIAATSARQTDGAWRLAYDPAIRTSLPDALGKDVLLWDIWDGVRCPVLVLRGGDSDLLRADTATEMTRRGPRASLIEFRGIGHAPALMSEDQIATIEDWLVTS
jgi:pimeloyl-ACP methyl ester carboxylesterase